VPNQEAPVPADTIQVTSTLRLQPETGKNEPQTLRAGRSWHYQGGYLINQFLGRFGHTPSWIVEVEGASFQPPDAGGFWPRLRALWRSPKIVRRNERRLAFAWPLRWPPPDRDEQERFVALALATAGRLGRALPTGCGVCGRPWEGGPTMVEERARHLCPDCAGEIERARNERPPGTTSTWLWCGVAGFAGLWLQVLFHAGLGWSTLPLAVVSGWLMGSANGPNLDRRPVTAAAVTLLLIGVFQVAGLTLIAAMKFGYYQLWDLTRLYFWMLSSPSAHLVTGCLAGAAGLSLALFERRLRKA
jgi:hypothetical protein